MRNLKQTIKRSLALAVTALMTVSIVNCNHEHDFIELETSPVVARPDILSTIRPGSPGDLTNLPGQGGSSVVPVPSRPVSETVQPGSTVVLIPIYGQPAAGGTFSTQPGIQTSVIPLSSRPINGVVAIPVGIQPIAGVIAVPVGTQPVNGVFTVPVQTQPNGGIQSFPIGSQPTDGVVSVPGNTQPNAGGIAFPVGSQPAVGVVAVPVPNQPDGTYTLVPVPVGQPVGDIVVIPVDPPTSGSNPPSNNPGDNMPIDQLPTDGVTDGPGKLTTVGIGSQGTINSVTIASNERENNYADLSSLETSQKKLSVAFGKDSWVDLVDINGELVRDPRELTTFDTSPQDGVIRSSELKDKVFCEFNSEVFDCSLFIK